MLLYEKQRIEIQQAAIQMLEKNLIINSSGNASIKVSDHILITPSSLSYKKLKPKDIMVLDIQGKIIDGDLLPSSETALHLSIYKNIPSVKAIVHTHSMNATAISTILKELPAIHYQIADLGGPVLVAPYRTFGSQELAEVVTKALEGRFAALMQNHGGITIGQNIDQALSRSITLEWLSGLYLKAIQNGNPSFINDQELKKVSINLENLFQNQNKNLLKRKK